MAEPRVHQVACKDVAGTVHTLERPNRHHNILWMFHCWGLWCPHPGDQGFILEDGRFVGRKEAARIAVETGQITAPNWPPDLYSEDLW